MSTVTSILGTDIIANSRSTINSNFHNLNTDKTQLSSVLAYGLVMNGASGANTLTPIASLGTSGQVLTSNGSAAFPTFQSNSSITIESTAATTHSLTTLAGQRVTVWAKGYVLHNADNADITVELAYNTVAKDTVHITLDSDSNTWRIPFALMYTEIPGAATQNVTIATSGGSIQDPVILVFKTT